MFCLIIFLLFCFFIRKLFYKNGYHNLSLISHIIYYLN